MSSVKRPQDTAFKQQRLKAWQPLLTPKWVIGTFAVTGILFVTIGIIMAVVASGVQHYEVPYPEDCQIGQDCTITLTTDADMKTPVYVYYKLTNFYQNHRRYVKSRDDKQLRGLESDLSSCTPLINSRVDESKKLYPCGLIANSFFNDEISAKAGAVDLTLSKENIIWESDKQKFKASELYTDSNEFTTETSRDGVDISLPPVTDRDLIVWMRTAGLPTFKKLYGVVESFESGVIKADTRLEFNIKNNFATKPFGGTKSIVVATTSVLGGKNTFLTWAYIVVGILCLLTALAFGFKHATSPRKPGDLAYWEKNHSH